MTLADDPTVSVTSETAPARDTGVPSTDLVPASRYELGRELAIGGMGRIVLARDVKLQREVALKFPRDSAAGLAAALEREARITARLQHPSIVPIYEAGRLTTGQVFYAMPWVDGQSLDRAIAGATQFADRLGLVPHLIAVAEAVAYAHARRVIHRDLKPGNVVVGPFGEIVVIDWGLARHLDDEEPPKVAGTPAYMAPEQARGEPAGTRSDVFALGAMLHHMLVGQTPGEALELPADTPADLAAIVRKAKARDPHERYADAGELAADLRRFQTGKLVGAHSYRLGELLGRWVRKHRALVALALVALVTVGVVGGISVRRISQENAQTRQALDIAQRARASEEAARHEAERRRDELLLAHARGAMSRDPTAAVAWLASYVRSAAPDWDAVRGLATEAVARGVARHVWLGCALTTPNGQRTKIAAVRGGAIVVFDVATGAATRIDESGEDVRGFAWSADGDQLAAIGEKRARVFSLAGTPVRTFELTAPGRTAAFVGASGLLVGGKGGALDRIELASGSHRALVGHETTLESVRVTPDGATALTTTVDGEARLWKLAAGTSEVLPDTRSNGSAYVALSADGRRVAWGSEDGKVRWREVAGGPVHALAGHVRSVAGVDWDEAAQRIASSGSDQTVRIWDVATGTARILEGHRSWTSRAVFSLDGRYVASSSLDRDVIVWDLERGDRRVLQGHLDAVRTLAFASDALIVADGDDQLRIWPIVASPTKVLRGHTQSSLMVIARAGGLTTYCEDGTVRIWDIATGTSRVIKTPDTTFGGQDLTHDKRILASGGTEGRVWTLDLDTGEGRILGKHDGKVNVVAFSSDGQLLASGGADKQLRIWNLRDGTSRVFGGHEATIWSLAFSPDGTQLASGGDDTVLRVYDVATGTRRDFTGHQRWISGIAFLHDGRVVTASADATVRIWDLAASTHRILGRHDAMIGELDLSEDEKTVVTASDDRTARLWPLVGNAPPRVLTHDAQVVGTKYAPGGNWISTFTTDGAVRLWDATTGRLLAMYHEHDGSTIGVEFDAARRWFASAGEDMTVRVMPLPDPHPAAIDAAALARITSAQIGADDRPVSP